MTTRCAECDQPIEEHQMRRHDGTIVDYWKHIPDPNTGHNEDHDHTATPQEAPDG